MRYPFGKTAQSALESLLGSTRADGMARWGDVSDAYTNNAGIGPVLIPGFDETRVSDVFMTDDASSTDQTLQDKGTLSRTKKVLSSVAKLGMQTGGYTGIHGGGGTPLHGAMSPEAARKITENTTESWSSHDDDPMGFSSSMSEPGNDGV